MKTRYFVMYDISDPKRLRQVFDVMKGAGDHIQLSVFRCDLSDKMREELILQLLGVINAGDDQILLVPTGPAEGVQSASVLALGRPYRESSTGPIIV